MSYSGSGSVANNGTGSGISILFTSSGSPPTSGSLNLNAGGVISSNTGNGISASGFMGPAVVATSADVTGNALGTGSGSGISLTGFGPTNTFTPIDITANGGTVKGDTGLSAGTVGALKVTGDDAFVGLKNEGISTNNSFTVDLLGTGAVTGATGGILAVTGGALTISGTGAVLTLGGDGIFAISPNSSSVTIAPASSVTASGIGIHVNATGTAPVSVTTAGLITSGGAGINTNTTNGTTSITLNGNVSSSGAEGINATSAGGTVSIMQTVGRQRAAQPAAS